MKKKRTYIKLSLLNPNMLIKNKGKQNKTVNPTFNPKFRKKRLESKKSKVKIIILNMAVGQSKIPKILLLKLKF